MKQASARFLARVLIVVGGIGLIAFFSPKSDEAQLRETLRVRPSIAGAIMQAFKTDPRVERDFTPHARPTVRSLLNSTSCSDRLQERFGCSVPGCTDVKSDNGGFINYLFVQDCVMEGVSLVGWLLLLLWLIFLLYLLGDTADGFFCPALDVIVEVLRLSPNVAGVTFLSFGNGAPDVFASLAAFLSGAGQVGVSAILGAGVLVTSLVVGAVAFASPPNSRLDPKPFLRDVGFYIVAVSYLFFCFLDDHVHITEALGFLAIYAVFALAVVFGRRCDKPVEDADKPLLQGIEDDAIIGDAAHRDSLPSEDESVTLGESASQAAGLQRAAAIGIPRDITAARAELPDGTTRQQSRTERSASEIRGPNVRPAKAAKLGEIGRQRSMSTPWGRDEPINGGRGPLHAAMHRRGHTRWFERHTRHTHRLLAHLQRGEASSRADMVAAAVARSQRDTAATASLLRHGAGGGGADISASYAFGARGRLGSSFANLFGRRDSAAESNTQPPESTPASTRQRMYTQRSAGSNDSDEKAGVSVRPSPDDEAFMILPHMRTRTMSNASSYRRQPGASLYGVPDGVSEDVTELADRMAVEDWEHEEAAVAATGTCDGPIGNALGTVLTWMLLPSTLVRKVSVPVLTDEDYERPFCAITPLFGLPLITLIVYTTIGYEASVMVAPLAGSSPVVCPLAVAMTVGALASGVLFRVLPRNEPPTGPLLILLTLTAFVTAVSWIITIANEIVALLESLGLLLGVSTTVLGLTVLAWGNSLGDLVADVAVAKAGEPRMAIAATYAGPLFNLLVGLGLSLTVGALKSDTGYIALQTGDVRNRDTVFVCFAFLLFSLVASIIVIPLTNFQIKRWYGGCLMALYAVFLTTSISFQFAPLPGT